MRIQTYYLTSSEHMNPMSILLLLILATSSISCQNIRGSRGVAEGSEQEVVLRISPGENNPRNSEGDFITLKDGRILFVYSHYTGVSGADHATAYLAGRTSHDGGKSWTNTDVTIVENEGAMNVMSVSLLRLQSGKIALFYLRKNSATDCIPMMRISMDEGVTWSSPQACITDQAGYFTVNNDRVIQLRNGRIVMPVAKNYPGVQNYKEYYQLGTYYSDDDGRTWAHGSAVPAPEKVLMQEPGIIELKNGDLYMYIRTDAGVQYQSISNDRGVSWSPAEPSQIQSPLAPASMARIPSTGDLLLAWNNNGTDQKRTPLCVALSKDEGNTWENVKVVEGDPNGSFCYTAIHFTDEHVLLGYWNRADKNNSSTDIKRFNIKELY